MTAAPASNLPAYLRLMDLEEYTSLFFSAGEPETTQTIFDLDHEPNGYFWEGVVRRLAELGAVEEPSMDPEGGMFSAQGTRPQMERLAQALLPYLTDPEQITALVQQADTEGFDFDD